MIRFHLKWMKTWVFANLRSLSFYLLTIILTLGFGLTDSVVKEVNEDTEVLVYVDNSQVGEYVCNYLKEESPDGFIFTQTDSLIALKESVCKSQVPCGVVFTSDSDNYESQSGVVNIYQAAGTADGYVVQEIIYPIMYRADGEERLKQYLAGLKWEDNQRRDLATQQILDWYRDYLDTLGVHIYDVVVTGADTAFEGDSYNINTSVIAYVIIILFAAGICIYDVAGSDRGFYRIFGKGYRFLLYVEKVFVTLVMSTTFSLILKSALLR